MDRLQHRNFPLARLVGRGRSIAVLIAGVVLGALVVALAPAGDEGSGAGSNLPADAESALAAERLAALPEGEDAPAIVVYSRDDGLAEADLGAIAEQLALIGETFEVEVGGPIPSEDGSVALAMVPVPGDLSSDANADRIDQLRELAGSDLPAGVSAEVTGGPAIQADLGDVFAGADVRLLVVTAIVVALLLIVTYRSPWLWIVPLSVIGLADRVAAKVIETISAWTTFTVDGSITGITSVLVFGAGTNYALLLIARYREELRRHEDRHEAMRRAVGAAAPAILSSSGTVILGLLALQLADSPFVSRIGLAGGAGLVVAVFFALVVLPAAMSLPGRWLFWPFVPRVGDEDQSQRGLWRRIGEAVTARPVTVTAIGLLTLTVMALGTLGIRTGLGQSEQFLDTPESIRAQDTLETAFPAGTATPTVIAADPSTADHIVQELQDLDGVQSVEPAGSDESTVEIRVVLQDEPGSDAALDMVGELREVTAQLDPGALVGGPDAEALDESATASGDRLTIIPVVLVIVLVMLLVLLRSVVAAVLLAGSTVLSYLSALGVGWLLFDHVLGWSAMDVSTPLLGFIFLVALGVDYNIFLTARAREEMTTTGDATASIVTALAVTGGVITSAGILLAAVFTVLGVLPLVLLAQLGVLVGFGVLLDTVVVRGLVTPAMVAWCGPRFWWPSRLGRRA